VLAAYEIQRENLWIFYCIGKILSALFTGDIEIVNNCKNISKLSILHPFHVELNLNSVKIHLTM